MEKKVFQSHHLQQGTYDPDTRTLHLQFVSGPTHVYTSIPPSLWSDLKQATSPGQLFHQKIRNNPLYPSYPLHAKPKS